MDPADPPLAVHPCQGVCSWSAQTETVTDAPQRFVCAACRSEWARTESWTPIGRDGLVPADVRREADRR